MRGINGIKIVSLMHARTQQGDPQGHLELRFASKAGKESAVEKELRKLCWVMYKGLGLLRGGG